ncbi:crotonyl-CoA carboxylase/reductase [Malaciobacter molluscorum]|uniref:crotonyl-CoA carboxylase/reductase n=1 Tax=Malaciobacter molluscorum TaxID=1032072 RepID=UPI00100B20D6|nr:crotonyl-CoA carboxylase/reductase [Malaciobacter molluscorum]RXJ94838.1 crotonyl-CoA carboxylase/reductase [Malaciobacter molluscorum]
MLEVEKIVEMIEDEKTTQRDFENFKLPDSMNALVILKEEEKIFEGIETEDKDISKSLHVKEVPIPEVGDDEVLVAVMASGINHNTVWSATFEPLPTFNFLSQYAKANIKNKKHNLNYHILGSDAAGIIIKVGRAVHDNWKIGTRVVICPAVTSTINPQSYKDSMSDPNTRAWGYETNFGGLAEFCLVKSTQLMKKPEHLSWEEAASLPLVSSTAYRMLVSSNGSEMRQGDNVLIWGGAGGLGAMGIQYVLNGGGRPIAVVSSEEKAQIVKKLGCEYVVDRAKRKFNFFKEDGSLNMRHLIGFKGAVEKCIDKESVDIVFEHTGRETFGASVFVAKGGGKVVTCGSTTGYEHLYDNRYLWMYVKSIIGSHGANIYEANNANRLSCLGKINPILSEVYNLDNVVEGCVKVKNNDHIGKVGVLCLSPQEGLGIRDHELRHKVGEDKINLFRNFKNEII